MRHPNPIAEMDVHNDEIGRMTAIFDTTHERVTTEMRRGEDCWTGYYDEEDKDEFICKVLQLVYARTVDKLGSHESNTFDKILDITRHCDQFVKRYAEHAATRAMENNDAVDQFMRALL